MFTVFTWPTFAWGESPEHSLWPWRNPCSLKFCSFNHWCPWQNALGKFKEKEPTCPQILCGDFNSPKSSEAYSLLAKELQDVFKSAPDLCTSGARSTIHKWQGLSFKEVMGDGTVDLSGELEKSKDEDTRHIDWILWQNGPTQFQSTQLQPVRCRVVSDTLANGRYPSDHFPLSATFLVSFTSVQSRLWEKKVLIA